MLAKPINLPIVSLRVIEYTDLETAIRGYWAKGSRGTKQVKDHEYLLEKIRLMRRVQMTHDSEQPSGTTWDAYYDSGYRYILGVTYLIRVTK